MRSHAYGANKALNCLIRGGTQKKLDVSSKKIYISALCEVDFAVYHQNAPLLDFVLFLGTEKSHAGLGLTNV